MFDNETFHKNIGMLLPIPTVSSAGRKGMTRWKGNWAAVDLSCITAKICIYTAYHLQFAEA